MKKVLLLLLPLGLGTGSAFAQDINIPDQGNGIEYINQNSPLPLLDDLANDRESRYTLTLLDNSNEVKPEWLRIKSIDDLLNEKNGLMPEKKLMDNTPYLPKRKFQPSLRGKVKS